MKTILDKINSLRLADKTFSVFGADDHQYVMDPVLTEAEIKEFEQKHNIQLPADYRNFLKTVGSGGCGPFYGLMSLFDESEQTNPAAPFPLSKDSVFRCVDAYDSIDESLDDDEQERLREEIFARVCCGYIFLAHEGCGMYSILIVNGKESGHVWYCDLANDAGIFPLVHPETGKPLSFLDWYLLWLDAGIEATETGTEMFEGYADFIPQDPED